jgi:hypothetical protein
MKELLIVVCLAFACQARRVDLAPTSVGVPRVSSWLHNHHRSSAAVAQLYDSSGSEAELPAAAPPSPSYPEQFPEYRFYSDKFLLSIQLLAPTFKTVGRKNKLVVDSIGRCMIQFLPRIEGSDSSGFSFVDRQSIALSPEEIGLIISQLPDLGVQIAREGRDGSDAQSDKRPGKVLTVVPSVDSSISFELASVDEFGNNKSMEMIMEAGEYEVIKSVWRAALPSLTGFDTILKMAVDASLRQALDKSGSAYSRGEDVPSAHVIKETPSVDTSGEKVQSSALRREEVPF